MSPMYDWECESCHYQFEKVTLSIQRGCQCPKCNQGARKIITKVPLMSYSNRPNERPWGSAHWRSDKKKGDKR